MIEKIKSLKIKVYYFSATGNTKYGLLLMQKYLASVGHVCDILSIENESNISKDEYDLLGFASPVYGGYPAKNMMSFIKQSDYSQNEIPAFTVLCPCSTIGYWGSREIFADTLKSKNIQVIKELGFLGNPSHPIVVGSMEDASPKLKSFFDGIGRPDSYDEKIIEEFSEKLVRTYYDYSSGRKIKKFRHSSIKVWASKKMYKKEVRVGKENSITVNKNKCTQCGYCKKICPSEAITLNPYPVRDLSKCFNCQKCTNLCPQNAFYLKGIELIGQYKGAFKKINKMSKSEIHNENKLNLVQHKKSLILKFFSTGVGMVVLLMLSKYSDGKVIKKEI